MSYELQSSSTQNSYLIIQNYALFSFAHIGHNHLVEISLLGGLAAQQQIVPNLGHLDQVRPLVLNNPVALVQQIDFAIELVVTQAVPRRAGEPAQQVERLAAASMERRQNGVDRLAAIRRRGIQARRMGRRQLGLVGLEQQPGALAEHRVDVDKVPKQLFERRLLVIGPSRQHVLVDTLEHLAQALLGMLEKRHNRVRAEHAHGLDRAEGLMRLGHRAAVRARADELALAQRAACRAYKDIADLVGAQVAILPQRALGTLKHVASQRVGASDGAGGDRLRLEPGQSAVDVFRRRAIFAQPAEHILGSCQFRRAEGIEQPRDIEAPLVARLLSPCSIRGVSEARARKYTPQFRLIRCHNYLLASHMVVSSLLSTAATLLVLLYVDWGFHASDAPRRHVSV